VVPSNRIPSFSQTRTDRWVQRVRGGLRTEAGA
jgi:hypothetical protein